MGSLKTPIIIMSPCDSIIRLNSIEMMVSKPVLYGLNVFDSINLSKEQVYKTSDFSEGFIRNEKLSHDNIVVYVDTTNIDFHSSEIGEFDFIPPPPPFKEKDTLKYQLTLNAFFEGVEKRKTWHYNTYPLIIKNASNRSTPIQRPLNGDLFFILEAINRDGDWKPIEYWEQRTFLCGTGHRDYVLKPKHFIVSTVKKYEGEYKTKLRVRFTSFNKVYFSNEYKGWINYSQFDTIPLYNNIREKFKKGKTKYWMNRCFLNPTY